jgi:hypothetical protein
MPVEFSKNTQKFGVRKAMEPIRPDEAVVKFENERAVRTFFNNAIENGINSMSIQRIANGIAPTFSSRSLKSSPSFQIKIAWNTFIRQLPKTVQGLF